MVQDVLTLVIVFLAVGYTVYSVVKSLTAKKNAKCDGCCSCDMKVSDDTVKINAKKIHL